MVSQIPSSITIRTVRASDLSETPRGYSEDFIRYPNASSTPTQDSESLPVSNPPLPRPQNRESPPRCLGITHQVRKRIIETEDAIQIVYTPAHYDIDSFETDDEETYNSLPPQPRTASRAAIYLRSYLRHAELPELYRGGSYYGLPLCPLIKEAKRNLLVISPNPDRPQAYAILDDNIYGAEDFLTMVNTGIPDCTEDEALTLKATNGTDYIYPESKVSPWYPKDLVELIEWIDCYPIKTLTRAIHLANPSTTPWWFERISPKDLGEDFVKNRRMLAVLGWRFHPNQSRPIWFKEVDEELGWILEGEEGLDFYKVHPHKKSRFIPSSETSIAVIIQPPWILGWADLEDVVNCQDLPGLIDPSIHPSKHYTMAQRVWCQIRDACQKLNTKFFILTTYEGWVFGKFGGGKGGSGYIPGSGCIHLKDKIPDMTDWEYRKVKVAPWAFDQWSYVETSDLLGFNASKPTIMQFLYFWVARSMGLKKSREMPLEICLTDQETIMVETPQPQTKPLPQWPSYYDKSKSPYHTGNRPRPLRPSNRFAPYSQRPSRSTFKKKDDPKLSTGPFAFIKHMVTYFSSAIM
ncbi:hypothetical protein Clacol_009886 [Clathrus columnatus]|uniref:Uncharacterized protein n=1 Tax=Clathrus columnatus TaxID=1419009 RepID=A0AAV5ARF4_9AGAM|nr:hypothetical protein Clacol_009886 [Clathrus columnatus]